jgi:SSS family solute:Na+ symporter
MVKWLIILGIIYLGILFTMALISKSRNRSSHDFIFAGSNIGLLLGFMSFAATLFSTFTLMGMPDFFRTHGVGAWMFLAFSDGVMVFFILFFGYHLRKKVAEKGFNGISSLLQDCYGNKWAGYVYFIGIFIFLIPYTSIQIRGMAIFLSSAFPEFLPVWGWSLAMVTLILIYSETGGLKAIMFADVFQGLLLLVIVWIIAITCINHFDGMSNLFKQVEQTNVKLLSVPGPKGLFTFQFLLASLIVIVLIPVSQPQLTIRLVIMKTLKTTHRMAIAVGSFAIVIILSTVFIGLYGAVLYPDQNTADYLTQVLLFDQNGMVAALAIIGLMAAALSTSDSQLFALGTELRSITPAKDGSLLITRLGIIFFATAALVFANLADDRLVILARVSFAGTAMSAPLILTAILSKNKPPAVLIYITAAAILVFLLSLMEIIPSIIGTVRLDLILLVFLALFSISAVMITNRNIKQQNS